MKKKGLIIRGTVVAVLIAGVMITGCKKDDTKKVNVGKASPEKTIETYCNSLVEKKYADILDLAYFPKSDYITSEKIKDSKSGFIDKMVEENEGVKDCTYDKIDETKDIISYKLIITTDNGDETRDEIEEAKEQVKTSYSNEYFEVEVPESWEGDWSVIEEDNTNNGIKSTVYHFTYNPEGPDNGGASDVYVIDMSDTSRPMGHYNRMLPDYCEEVGVTSFGSNDVFKMEVAAGFFHDGGATITLK